MLVPVSRPWRDSTYIYLAGECHPASLFFLLCDALNATEMIQLSVLLFLVVTSSAKATSARRCIVDLSYKHHLGTDSITQSVCDAVRKAQSGGELEIDVSANCLEDGGLFGLVNALNSARDDTERADDVHIHLFTRMNRITAEGAANIFDCIVEAGRKETAAEVGIDEVAVLKGSTSRDPNNQETGDEFKLSSCLVDAASATEGNVLGAGVNVPKPSVLIDTLDIGLNDLGRRRKGRDSHTTLSRPFVNSLRSLIEGSAKCTTSSKAEEVAEITVLWPCPRVLRLDCCGLGPSACRAIGKGLLNSATFAYQRRLSQKIKSPQFQCLSCLYLSGNDAIGDSGAAALAAALRTAPRCASSLDDAEELLSPILNVLDLSSCGIGDVGAEALAMAIRDNPGCIKQLDLSNNRITNEGASAISRALVSNSSLHGVKKSKCKNKDFDTMTSIDLSGNKDLGDKGAAAIASAMECGSLKSVSIRSCSLKGDATIAFAKALLALAHEARLSSEISIDLSGNELGTLRSKTKSSSPYSASLLKSKASATTASYMNFIGKKIKSGLKDAGLDVSQVVGNFIASSESDDDEEAMIDLEGTSEKGMVESKTSVARCGARSFTETFMENLDQDKSDKTKSKMSCGARTVQSKTRCHIGMRQCFLDQGAADALSSAIITGQKMFGLELAFDLTLNQSLKPHVISALLGGEHEEDCLRDMGKRHLDAAEALSIARQRAAEAAEAAVARFKAEQMMSNVMDIRGEYSDFGGIPEDVEEDYNQDYGHSDDY